MASHRAGIRRTLDRLSGEGAVFSSLDHILPSLQTARSRWAKRQREGARTAGCTGEFNNFKEREGRARIASLLFEFDDTRLFSTCEPEESPAHGGPAHAPNPDTPLDPNSPGRSSSPLSDIFFAVLGLAAPPVDGGSPSRLRVSRSSLPTVSPRLSGRTLLSGRKS